MKKITYNVRMKEGLESRDGYSFEHMGYRFAITRGAFDWTVDSKGKTQRLAGKWSLADDLLTLVQSGQGGALVGRVAWQKFKITAWRNLPFPSDLSAKFTLRPDSFSLTQLQWKIPHSEIDAQANLTSFLKPGWNFRYRGQLNFEDIRSILRKPNTPA